MALLLSNSFGTYFARHLAPGFRSLHHVNVNHLRATEAPGILEVLLKKLEPTDLIYLVHDGGLPNPVLKRMFAAGDWGG